MKMWKQQGLLSTVSKNFVHCKSLMEPHVNFCSTVLYGVPGYLIADIKKCRVDACGK